MIKHIDVEAVSREEQELPRTASLAGRIAVVTGASSGIGRAIAIALSRQGACLCAVGRNEGALAKTISAARRFSEATSFQIDITQEEDFKPLLQHLEEAGGLDILIHSAGMIRSGLMECASIEDFDLQFATNVRGPYLLTQRLLPLLIAGRGQIVFINSSAGLATKQAALGQYSATKHALKAVADSLRAELNPKGVRVLSVFLGRTATPMQEAIFQQEGKNYRPEMLLQPEDVASVIVHALKLPCTAEVTDINIRPMQKSY
jgi:NAD(P)-dependent dehydrogenase (short-subunit alcohol dehydrogenase family)